MKTVELPTLFSSTSFNKKQYWKIKVEEKEDHAVIVVKYGLLNGKETVVETPIYKGKNIGRSNETTPFSQAVSQAEAKWVKKKHTGYFPQEEQKSFVPLPMLALDFTKRGNSINFPCYVQPKLDGVRAILKDGNLYSRTGHQFPHLTHICNELMKTNLVLDGELYSTLLGFQDIVGIVRKQKIREEDISRLRKIIFVVYDVICLDDDYQNRFVTLNEFFEANSLKFSKLHLTEQCDTRENVEDFLKKYINDGHEGLILRNFTGKYHLNYRSKDLQKYKLFKDAEFLIVGATQGTGIEEGLVIWECETETKTKFTVRPKGSHEERVEYFKNAERYIGKKLTVKFYEYTEDGIPRFPVGIAIRDYEDF